MGFAVNLWDVCGPGQPGVLAENTPLLQSATGRCSQRAHKTLELGLEMVIKWMIKVRAALFQLCAFDCKEANNGDVNTSVVPGGSPVCRAWRISKGIVPLHKQGMREVGKSEYSSSGDSAVVCFPFQCGPPNFQSLV